MSINKSLPGTHQLAPVQPFKEVSQYFNHRISIDTKGPLFPPSNGYNHLIVIVDAFTHYVVVNPVVSASAVNVLGTLFEHWITKFGIPENIVTDNGTEYINSDITHFCEMYDIRHKPRTTHAPWTIGLVKEQTAILANTFAQLAKMVTLIGPNAQKFLLSHII